MIKWILYNLIYSIFIKSFIAFQICILSILRPIFYIPNLLVSHLYLTVIILNQNLNDEFNLPTHINPIIRDNLPLRLVFNDPRTSYFVRPIIDLYLLTRPKYSASCEQIDRLGRV